MIKSLFAAVLVFLASIFGGHVSTTPTQPAAVAAVVQNEAPVTAPVSEAPTPPTPAPATPLFSPTQGSPTKEVSRRAPAQQTVLAQRIVLGTTTNSLPTPTLLQLQAQIAGLQVQINQLLNTQRPTTYSSSAPAVQTFLGNTIPSTNELPSGSTVGGAPIATTQDVSQSSLWTVSGSDIYYNGGNVGINNDEGHLNFNYSDGFTEGYIGFSDGAGDIQLEATNPNDWLRIGSNQGGIGFWANGNISADDAASLV